MKKESYLIEEFTKDEIETIFDNKKVKFWWYLDFNKRVHITFGDNTYCETIVVDAEEFCERIGFKGMHDRLHSVSDRWEFNFIFRNKKIFQVYFKVED